MSEEDPAATPASEVGDGEDALKDADITSGEGALGKPDEGDDAGGPSENPHTGPPEQ